MGLLSSLKDSSFLSSVPSKTLLLSSLKNSSSLSLSLFWPKENFWPKKKFWPKKRKFLAKKKFLAKNGEKYAILIDFGNFCYGKIITKKWKLEVKVIISRL